MGASKNSRMCIIHAYTMHNYCTKGHYVANRAEYTTKYENCKGGYIHLCTKLSTVSTKNGLCQIFLHTIPMCNTCYMKDRFEKKQSFNFEAT